MKLLAIMMALACFTTSSFAENGTIKIYDAKFAPEILIFFKSGKLVLDDGKKVGLFVSKDARAAHDNLTKVRDFYSEKFSRNSWDNKGADILAAVNVNKFFSPLDLTGQRQNAAWAETRFLFGAGSRNGIDNMVNALDVIGHEYTHAVVQTTSNLNYEGQSGGLNEHLADVFGVLINIHYNNPEKPYLVGATILNGKYAEKAEALRDMMHPERGLSPQPTHMRDLELPRFVAFKEGCVSTKENDNCGVHDLSGIPNRMAALVISKIGISEAGNLFYNVMTKRLRPESKFADYRVALMEECKTMASDTCTIVDSALKAVGI